jgi:serine O-acetyltransferase
MSITDDGSVHDGTIEPTPRPLWVVEDGVTVQRSGLTVRELLAVLSEEYHKKGRSWHHPGFRAIVVYRFGVWANSLDRSTSLTNLRARVLSALYLLGHRYVRNNYGIEVHRESVIGRGAEFVHQHGIQVFKHTVIGDRTRIMHDVTLGNAGRGGGRAEAPILGSDVLIGAGAKIMGRVRIGDGARIGPNVVIYTDIPPGATVVASSPRILYAPETMSKKAKAKAKAAEQAAQDS